MEKLRVNEIVNIIPLDNHLKHHTNSVGIIRDIVYNNCYLVYSCYDGDLIELIDSELVSTGRFSKYSQFDFFEIVTVISDSEYSMQKGFIGGKSQNEKGEWYYAVFLFDKQESYGFEEYELESTGEFAKKEDFYSGERIKVLVYPDGRG